LYLLLVVLLHLLVVLHLLLVLVLLVLRLVMGLSVAVPGEGPHSPRWESLHLRCKPKRVYTDTHPTTQMANRMAASIRSEHARMDKG
jgi:hypothetical protein